METSLIKQDNSLSIEAERKIIAYEEAIKEIEKQKEQFKIALMEEMKKRGILTYKDENLSISLMPESEADRFDTGEFKKRFPDIYLKYTKKVKRKGYVKIQVKKNVTSQNMVEDVTPDVLQLKVVNNVAGEIENV